MDKNWFMDGSKSQKLIKFVSTNVKDNWVHKTEKLLKWKMGNLLILKHNFFGVCTNKK